MIVLVSVTAAIYLLRIALITLVPAGRLPAPVRRALIHLAPAALAALVATALVGDTGLAALLTPTPAFPALLVAGLVAWRVRNLALPVLAAVAVCVVWGIVW